MFTHASMLYIFTETPLHAGSGRGLGAVDLPIQRERATNYPLIQASGVKGKLRAEAYASKEFQVKFDVYLPQERDRIRQEMLKEKAKRKEKETLDEKEEKEIENKAWKIARKKAAKELGIEATFGPETDEADEHAGAFSPGDARILLLPVRSLAGVFAWATSADVLSRFKRDASATGLALEWNVSSPPAGAVLIASDSDLKAGDKIVLEEFCYEPKPDAVVKQIAEWLVKNALPQGTEYAYWQGKLPKSLVILPEDEFRDFALYSTEVATRIRLDQDTKTVEGGALWTEESLPADTLLYAPLYATRPRDNHIKKATNQATNSAEIFEKVVRKLTPARVQLGGDETVGRGLVALRFGDVKTIGGNQ